MERKQFNWVLLTWVVAGLVILAVFFIVHRQSKANEAKLTVELNHRRLTLARVTARSVSRHFEDLEMTLEFMCSEDEIGSPGSPGAKHELQRSLARLSSMIDDLCLVDTAGTVIVSARGGPISEGLRKELKPLLLALADNQPVAISDIYDKAGRGGEIALAMPMKHGGVLDGSIVAIIPLAKLSTPEFVEAGSAKDSDAWIIDDKSNVIASPKHPEMMFANVSVSQKGCGKCHKDMKLERRMTEGLPGIGELSVKSAVKEFVAFHPARVGQKVWTVAVAVPYSEAARLIHRSIWYFTGLRILIVAALVGAALIVSRVVSENVRAEERMRWTEYAARSERLTARNMLSAKFAHEVRNPLTSIALNTDLLKDEIEKCKGPDSAEARILLSSIGNEVERLKRVSDEYLQFARLQKLRTEQVNINAVLLQLIGFLRGELESHRVKLTTNLDGSLPRVPGDANQLRQAFINVVKNAMEAMPKGGEIKILTRKSEGRVEVEISDTGVGIHEADIENVFVPFFSTKEHGTGLGLPVTREVAREHGGEITLKSVPGKGTAVLFTIPTGEIA
ncbi:MAG: ATP-binding protein [Candidatus Eisenbacteria bacterium]|nr:ATP-binding protein [Candidatus Eisenbacteria bacterium]